MIGHVADSLSEAGYDMLLFHEPIASADEFMASRAYRQSEGIIFIGQGKAHLAPGQDEPMRIKQ